METDVPEGAPPTGSPASAEVPRADDTAPAVARRPSSLEALKAEIARAMQVAADRERERIDAGVGEDESAQVEKILARAAAEAAELSKHADEDVSLVNVWYESEVKRIRKEADRQIDERRAGLEQSLTHHGSLIEAETESVHVAVQALPGVARRLLRPAGRGAGPERHRPPGRHAARPAGSRRDQGRGPVARDAGARAGPGGRDA